MDRQFFYDVGSYDDQMQIWGGENIEMSIRVWCCGGTILRTPCSQVGHVYRDTSPHDIPGGFKERLDYAKVNTKRFVEVWLGKYKNFYYLINPCKFSFDTLSKKRRGRQ